MPPVLDTFADRYSPAFLEAVGFILQAEGGFSHHPADAGGRTAFGIAQAFHPAAWADGRVDLAEALEIYHRDYWLPLRGDDLPPVIALVLFDTAVLCGVRRAAQWLQMAVNEHWVAGAWPLREPGTDGRGVLHTQLAVDGRIGPRTIATIQALASLRLDAHLYLAGSLTWRRQLHHAQRVGRQPDQAAFILGWTRRCAGLADRLWTLI